MQRSRSLTEGEIKLAQSLFGDSIDYAAVKIHDGRRVPFQPNNSGMTPNGEIYMSGCYSDDYTQKGVPSHAFFLHEMTHVWQYQNKILHPILEATLLQLKHKFNYASAYSFSLDTKKDLTDYNMEQQAAIIEDYYFFKNGYQTGQCTDKIPAQEKLDRFEKVLENFLKNPSYATRKHFFSPRPRFGR